MIQRIIKPKLIENLKGGNVTILLGARRTGKTFLMNQIIDDLKDYRILKLNGEDFDIMEVLSSGKTSVLNALVADYDYLFIDEAQNIPNIGKNLKLLVDTRNDLAVFATGSASFDLKNKTGEPLTGRSRTFVLLPFAASEVSNDFISSRQELNLSLIYGSYPQVFNEINLNEKRSFLEDLKNSYLLKDILVLNNLKDNLFIMNLLKLIAYQIGKDISYNELANSLDTTVKTIQRYLDLLEKTFVIFRLYGYSKNLRKEVSKSPRFYFWDNGIRNAVISNFNLLDSRQDVGQLWENYCISERIKISKYNNKFANYYFWRTYDQQEIDLIEEVDANISAFEFKFGNRKVKTPKAFKDNYPDAVFTTINKDNFFDYLNFRKFVDTGQ